MANDHENPNFDEDQEELLDERAIEEIEDVGVQYEVVEGESDSEADATDKDGVGWAVVEVVARIKRCKAQ